MMVDEAKLEMRAKRAYELRRFFSSLPILGYVVPLVTLSTFICGKLELSCAIGMGLAAITIGSLWKGEDYGRAVRPALTIGAGVFALPAILHVLGLCCKNDFETALCFLTGIGAGFLVAKLSAQAQKSRIKYLVSAGLVTGLVGSLGCAGLGVAAMLGASAGVVFSTVPVLAWCYIRNN